MKGDNYSVKKNETLCTTAKKINTRSKRSLDTLLKKKKIYITSDVKKLRKIRVNFTPIWF